VVARASNVAEAAAAAAAAPPTDKGQGHRTTPGGSKRKHQTAGGTTGGSGRSPKDRAAGGASTGRKRPALRSEEEDSSEEEDEGEHEDDAHAMEEAEDESDEDAWKEVKVDIQVGTDFTARSFQSEMLIMRKLDDLLSDDDDEANEQLSANCTGDDISTELLARSYPDHDRWGGSLFGKKPMQQRYTLMLGTRANHGMRNAPKMVALSNKSWGKWGKAIARTAIAESSEEYAKDVHMQITICSKLVKVGGSRGSSSSSSSSSKKSNSSSSSSSSNPFDDGADVGAEEVISVEFLHPAAAALVHTGVENDPSATLEVGKVDVLISSASTTVSKYENGDMGITGMESDFPGGSGVLAELRQMYINKAKSEFSLEVDGLLLALTTRARSFAPTCAIVAGVGDLFDRKLNNRDTVRIVMRQQPAMVAERQPIDYDESMQHMTMVQYFENELNPKYKVSDSDQRRHNCVAKGEQKARAIKGIAATVKNDWWESNVPGIIVQIWAGVITGEIVDVGSSFVMPPPCGWGKEEFQGLAPGTGMPDWANWPASSRRKTTVELALVNGRLPSKVGDGATAGGPSATPRDVFYTAMANHLSGGGGGGGRGGGGGGGSGGGGERGVGAGEGVGGGGGGGEDVFQVILDAVSDLESAAALEAGDAALKEDNGIKRLWNSSKSEGGVVDVTKFLRLVQKFRMRSE
jgi:hypothetical protein